MKGISRGAITAMLSVGLFSLFALYAVRHDYRSDATLKAQFLEHRADFEKLVAMAQEDVHLTRIAPDFTWLDDSVAWPRKNVGISEQRWNEYRMLFRKVNAVDGLEKDPDALTVLFPIISEGLVPAGSTKGLVYSAAPLNPVLKSLNERPPEELYERSHVLAYTPIEDHWYIYYEEW